MTECSWWSHLSRGSLCLWWAAVAPAMAQDVKSQAWKPAVYSDHFDEWYRTVPALAQATPLETQFTFEPHLQDGTNH